MKNAKAPPAARVAASVALLDRAYGKAPQAVAHMGASEMEFQRMTLEELKAYIFERTRAVAGLLTIEGELATEAGEDSQ